MRIYVGNLEWETDDKGLRGLFTGFGQVSLAMVVLEREHGRSKGFGFVEMPVEAEARAAISTLAARFRSMGAPTVVTEAHSS
ncbi:MAG: RNA-binding protein [SAR202 cluster bacterium]|nr:RNA-binding protein [SAR202 cluster bacterium]